jgi:dTDP-4-amino-4,6-dideoxygalactose transaminase
VNIPLVDLKAGYQPLKSEILKVVEEVLEGMNLHIGPNVRALESEFAAYCGVKYAIGVGSGTDAILIALKSAGIKPGDEVITTPHTFFATIEAIVLAGAMPVFVDIDPVTCNIDPSQVEKKISGKTKALIPVHMYGQAADMAPLMVLAQKHGLKIVEDACQAHGAEYASKRCGSFSTAGCFSFYYTKNLGGYGEGGIITTDDPTLAEIAGKYRTHGHKSKYEHEMIAYNSRLDEVQAAILRIRLKHLEEYNASRRSIAAKYNALLKDTPLVLPQEVKDRKHVYHLYVVRSKKRDALMQYLSESGVGTGIHYKTPVHLQEACVVYGHKKGDFPVAEGTCEEILSLPIYPELKDEQIKYVADKVKEFYAKT